MDRHEYTDKCLALLSAKQFTTLTSESKVQRTLRNTKSNFTEQEHKKLYSTKSCPMKFYGTSKLQKIPVNGNIDDLTIRTVVSNINTASYI